MNIRKKAEKFQDKNGHKFLYRLIERFIMQISQHRISNTGAMLTYYFVLALFPFLIFMLTLISYTPLFEYDFLSGMLSYVPLEVGEFIMNVITGLVSVRSETLLSVSIIFSLYSASKGIDRLLYAVNEAYNTDDNRSFIKRKIVAIFFTIFVALLIVVLLLTIVFGRLIVNGLFELLNVEDVSQGFYHTLRIIIPLSFMFLIFTLLYRFGPSEKNKYRYVLPGAIFSTVVSIVASLIFAFYVENFANYNITYGSLAGIIILLLWIDLICIIIMIGAEINGSYLYVDTDEKHND